MRNVNAIRRVVMRTVRAFLALSPGVVAACASPPGPFPDLPSLDVATHIGSRNMCGLGVSPAISITNAPEAAARYQMRLTNLDVLFQQSWQTTAPAKPGGYAEGALLDYEGPCVGDLRLYSPYPYYNYRFEVLALDAQDRPLAYGRTALPVRNISDALSLERAPQRRAPPPEPPPVPAVINPGLNPVFNPALQPRITDPIYGQ